MIGTQFNVREKVIDRVEASVSGIELVNSCAGQHQASDVTN